MVARLVRDEKVAGSNPVAPTIALFLVVPSSTRKPLKSPPSAGFVVSGGSIATSSNATIAQAGHVNGGGGGGGSGGTGTDPMLHKVMYLMVSLEKRVEALETSSQKANDALLTRLDRMEATLLGNHGQDVVVNGGFSDSPGFSLRRLSSDDRASA